MGAPIDDARLTALSTPPAFAQCNRCTSLAVVRCSACLLAVCEDHRTKPCAGASWDPITHGPEVHDRLDLVGALRDARRELAEARALITALEVSRG